MRAIVAAISILFVALFVIGFPRSRSAAAPPPHIRPHVVQTGQEQQPAPSELRILQAEAPEQPAPPGVLLVENNPQYPQDGQSHVQSINRFHGLTHRFAVAPRPISRHARQGAINPNNVTTSGPNTTGINRWWTYEGDGIGGVGRYLVNVASGNLVVQARDMAISHRGVELSLQRTYNSSSQHDYVLPNGTDGSGLDNYGDGWTNTFDAHIAFNDLTDTQCTSSGTGSSVFDVAGARYDYAFRYNVTTHICNYVPPPGQFATLTVSGDGLTYYWTKKSGTKYAFHSPIAQFPGNDGRLLRIWGRNQNASLAFSYCYDGGSGNTSDHLNAVLIKPETSSSTSCTTVNGNALMLFSDFSVTGGTRRLLSTLIWPDGTQVTYNYDTSGRLIKANEPANNSANIKLHQWYSYYSGGHLLSQVNGGRWSASNGTDGGYLQLSYLSTGLTSVQYYGFINPTISDGTGTSALQTSKPSTYGTLPGAPYRTVTFAFPNSSPSPAPAPYPQPSTSPYCTSAGNTPLYDSDGHENIYCFDSSNRVVQTDAWTGSQWLVSSVAWDASNNPVKAIDVRGKVADYAYDANGNTIAVGLPQVTTSAGTFRPTSMYVYDGSNNLVNYCDPVYVGNRGYVQGSSSPPSTSICTPQSGVISYTYPQPGPGYEPLGELTGVRTAGNGSAPNGYLNTIAYPAPGSSDFGQPISMIGDSFSQAAPLPSASPAIQGAIQPKETFVYDTYGNMICSSSGQGVSVRQFDTANREVAAADADDNGVVVNRASCPANPSPGPTASTAAFRTYFPNGQIKQTQNSPQYANSTADAMTYDEDGDLTSVTTWTGGVQTTKQMWYDAADRLVEVQEPSDSRTWTPAPSASPPYNNPMPYDLSGPLLTRYFYDLAAGGTVGIGSVTGLQAHGGLYKTVLYLPNGTGYSWQDKNGNAFDSLDRPVAGYKYAPGDTTLHSSAATYDGGGYLGLENHACNEATECQDTTFDDLARALQVSFSGGNGEPTRTYVYDPDGRIASVTSSVYGTQAYVYDAEGHVVTSTEASSGGVTSPATLTYEYYANGWKKDLQVSSSAWTQSSSSPAFVYFYRSDGKLAGERFNHSPDAARDFTWTYTAAGRPMSSTDPYLSPAHTYTYDAFGRLQSYSLAAGSYSSIQYDDEGEMTSFSDGTGATPIVYNVRGEIASFAATAVQYNPDSGYTSSAYRQQSAYGAAVTQGFLCVRISQLQISCHYGDNDSNSADPKEGVRTSFTSGADLGNNANWGYDSAGRQNSTGGCNAGGTQCGSYTRLFDVENHTVEQDYTNWPVAYSSTCVGIHVWQGTACLGGLRVQYGWGPNGHPITIGSTLITPWSASSPNPTPPPASQVQRSTLHWDGNVLLFTTNSNSTPQVEDIKVGSLADLTPLDSNYTRLTVWDRDTSGRVVSAHNDSTGSGTVGFAAWQTGDGGLQAHKYSFGMASVTGSTNYRGPTTFSGGVDLANNTNLVGRGGLIADPRPDGITDSYSAIQGVRTYDSQQNAWTTPDALPGLAVDPQSQKAYTWNRNNSVSYSDPTGYYPGIGNQGGSSVIFDPNSETSWSTNNAATAHDLSALRNYMTFVQVWALDFRVLALRASGGGLNASTSVSDLIAYDGNNGPTSGTIPEHYDFLRMMKVPTYTRVWNQHNLSYDFSLTIGSRTSYLTSEFDTSYNYIWNCTWTDTSTNPPTEGLYGSENGRIVLQIEDPLKADHAIEDFVIIEGLL